MRIELSGPQQKRNECEDAFSGQVVPLDIEESERIRQTVVASSRKQYSVPKATIEERMDVLFAVVQPAAPGLIVKKISATSHLKSDRSDP